MQLRLCDGSPVSHTYPVPVGYSGVTVGTRSSMILVRTSAALVSRGTLRISASSAPCRSSRRPSRARNTGPPVRPFPNGQVDRPRRARRERDGHHLGAAPGGDLAQVQSVGLAGQAAVPGQEPGKGEPFGVGERRLDGDEGSGRGGHRAPPGRAETRGGWTSCGPQRLSGNPP